MPPLDIVCLEFLTAATLPAAQPELAGLLYACVHGGASIGFLAPLTPVEANALLGRREAPGRVRQPSV